MHVLSASWVEGRVSGVDMVLDRLFVLEAGERGWEEETYAWRSCCLSLTGWLGAHTADASIAHLDINAIRRYVVTIQVHLIIAVFIFDLLIIIISYRRWPLSVRSGSSRSNCGIVVVIRNSRGSRSSNFSTTTLVRSLASLCCLQRAWIVFFKVELLATR